MIEPIYYYFFKPTSRRLLSVLWNELSFAREELWGLELREAMRGLQGVPLLVPDSTHISTRLKSSRVWRNARSGTLGHARKLFLFVPVVLNKSYPGLYPLCFFLFLFFVFCFLLFVFYFLFFVLLRQVLIYGNWRKSNYLNGSCNFLPFTINNGNRTKWSPIRTVIIRVIIKIVDFSITSTITDRIGRHQFLLQINNRYNFRKKNTFRTNISCKDNV